MKKCTFNKTSWLFCVQSYHFDMIFTLFGIFRQKNFSLRKIVENIFEEVQFTTMGISGLGSKVRIKIILSDFAVYALMGLRIKGLFSGVIATALVFSFPRRQTLHWATENLKRFFCIFRTFYFRYFEL